jgi:hypothetical protein
MLKRVVACADGWMPSTVLLSVDEMKAARKNLDELATAAGRDPKTIDILAYGYGPVTLRDPGMLRDLERAGIDWVSVGLGDLEGEAAIEALEDLARRLEIAPARR